MVVGYGLTESTATVSCTLPVGHDIGSVGVVLPGIEVKIGEDNEILLRGKTITKGCYKKKRKPQLPLLSRMAGSIQVMPVTLKMDSFS